MSNEVELATGELIAEASAASTKKKEPPKLKAHFGLENQEGRRVGHRSHRE